MNKNLDEIADKTKSDPDPNNCKYNTLIFRIVHEWGLFTDL